MTEADNFGQTFTLTLDTGNFIDGLDSNDITFGGDFSGMTLESVSRKSSASITVAINGTLRKITGTGTIAVSPAGTDINSTVTASVNVNCTQAPAADLVSLSVNEGTDGAGAELINNFMGTDYNYDVQADEDVEVIKITADTAPGTDVRILLNDDEKVDGIIELAKGTNTIKVVVSESGKADKTYNIVVYK